MIYSPVKIPKDLDERREFLTKLEGRNIAIPLTRDNYGCGRLTYDGIDKTFLVDGKPIDVEKLEELLILTN